MNIKLKGIMLSENQIKLLLDNCSNDKLKEAISLAYENGLKLKDIESKLDFIRRTIQYQITELGKETLSLRISFETIRQSCILRLFNQGFTAEYISKYLGYSQKAESLQYRRRVKGYVSLKDRFLTFQRDNYKCVFCSSKKNLVIDHIIPVSKGGEGSLTNLRTLCDSCNRGRGTLNA